MNVNALIIEQLDWDERLKSLAINPLYYLWRVKKK